METVQKIINGMLYSTAYATVIARGPFTLASTGKIALYKTNKGNYFELHYEVKPVSIWPPNLITVVRPAEIKPCTKEEARKFFENNDQKVTYFEAFDEELQIA